MPLRSAAFRRLWCSSLATSGAQAMERTATAWLTLQVGGGAVAIGLTFAARMLPALLLGLAAGTFADRNDRTRQLTGVAMVAALCMVAFGWLVGAAQIQIWQVIAFSFIAGCIQVFDTPARQALVLDIIPKERAARALAVNALGVRVVFALGALVAGLLIPLAGLARTYWLVAVAYGMSAVLVIGLRVVQEHRILTKPPPFAQAFQDAIRLISNAPAVRTLIIAGLVCEVFAFSHQSALPLFTQDVLAAGAKGLGTLNAAVSVGGAIAVMLLALLPGRVRLQPVLGGVFLLYGLSILALAGQRELTAAALVLVVIGMCAAAFDVLQQTLIQMSVSAEQRGRAVGLWVLSIGSAPLGHLEMGLLVAALGVPRALAINGTLTVVAALILQMLAPAYRWQPWLRVQPSGSINRSD